jgi:very-short-patch-repair endonuclease
MSQRVERARRLRRDQTDAERKLWLRLRDRRLNGWKFKRQVPIDRYVADFCCPDGRLIIELDGGQHSERTEADAKRTAVLESCGYLVLRFWNNDVMKNMDGVLEEIVATLPQAPSDTLAPSTPHPDPLPEGERGRRR